MKSQVKTKASKANEYESSQIERNSIWGRMMNKGYSRKEFLQFCAYAAATAGIALSDLDKVIHAMERKKRPPVVWMHFQECTCCSESFIRASHPIVADVILDKISLDYTETLQAAAGFQAEKSLEDTIKNYKGEYIVLVEGSIPTKDGGVYCTIAGKTALQILEEVTEHAAAIVAWGSCASFGCVQSARPNPTGATPVHKLTSKPVIRVPGCPPIADVMTGILTHILVFGKIPDLDSRGRPKEFYSRRVHDTCYRRANFDAGLFVESWDDENARKGYCLYKMGCRGPTTYNACGTMEWNGGVSFPIKSGHPCIGCSEDNFWDNAPFYQRLGGVTELSAEETADTIGIALTVGVGAGIAAHAIATNLRKRKLITQQSDSESESHKEKEK
ncbi:MAG: hydrogenase small subunit [Leptospiraceae bacterium]|nr:hydrogenase small subunit [Leptospiraceae bacterium]MDW7976338.1 hydrogenase small subunit [Leptospiraceae bacterium]